MELKMKRGRISEYVEISKRQHFDGARPWEVNDIALPCATQNELKTKQKHLSNVVCVAEELTCLQHQKLF
jgi:glutamate dehydrogenase/leucine dehydrogenase